MSLQFCVAFHSLIERLCIGFRAVLLENHVCCVDYKRSCVDIDVQQSLGGQNKTPPTLFRNCRVCHLCSTAQIFWLWCSGCCSLCLHWECIVKKKMFLRLSLKPPGLSHMRKSHMREFVHERRVVVCSSQVDALRAWSIRARASNALSGTVLVAAFPIAGWSHKTLA